jgi:hypothetical protein
VAVVIWIYKMDYMIEHSYIPDAMLIKDWPTSYLQLVASLI